MKKCLYIVILATIVAVSCTVTGTLNEEYIVRNEEPDSSEEVSIITFTLNKSGVVSIGIGGSGVVTINWGDGTPAAQHNLSQNIVAFERTYTNSTSRTITISGKSITFLECISNQITSVNASKITTLTHFNFSYNQLTALDLSANTALMTVNCSDNEMDAAALDAFLLSLHSNYIPSGKSVIISGNPGINAYQNKQIAINNGWSVDDFNIVFTIK